MVSIITVVKICTQYARLFFKVYYLVLTWNVLFIFRDEIRQDLGGRVGTV